ncbi:hypothetical protein CC2G_010124 [Coprinopsis cinerea AmutBmut pab1-1]|nr:hypothetical protein CC2G_010124 [Coprinopsis cinerea AmutBmut pab1-1]
MLFACVGSRSHAARLPHHTPLFYKRQCPPAPRISESTHHGLLTYGFLIETSALLGNYIRKPDRRCCPSSVLGSGGNMFSSMFLEEPSGGDD